MQRMAFSVWGTVKHYLNLFHLSLLYQVKEFFQNSTLHGVKYIAESDRPFAERFMWFLFTGTGFVSALVIIVSLWEKFQNNPTITGLDTNFQTAKLIFPTVLVCPLEAYDDQSIEEVLQRKFGDLEPEENELVMEFLQYLSELSLGRLENMDTRTRNFTDVLKNNEISVDSLNLRDLLWDIRVRCENLFRFCYFKEADINCCESLLPMWTEMGFCYGFNMKYLYSDDKSKNLLVNENLFDLQETDKKWSLLLYPKLSATVYIHSPFEVSSMEMASPSVQWNTDNSVDVLLTMKETITTEDTKQLSVGQRKCLFSDELTLDLFGQNEYSFSSCMVECRLGISMKLCNCILPFYSAPVDLREYPYCKMKDFECLQKNQRNLTDLRQCSHCELSCSLTIYEIEKLSKTDTTDEGNEDEGIGPYINIEYLTWPIIRYKREVLFGWVDLLVSFGGIAGLFLGFSILSGVEIIYFFTLRAVCMVIKEEEVLIQMDKKMRNKPLEEFYLGMKMKKPGKIQKNSEHFNLSEMQPVDHKVEKPKDILNQGPLSRPKRFASRAPHNFPTPYSRHYRMIFPRRRIEDVPIFPYLP